MHIGTDENNENNTGTPPLESFPLWKSKKTIQTVQIHMENSSFSVSVSETKNLLVQH